MLELLLYMLHVVAAGKPNIQYIYLNSNMSDESSSNGQCYELVSVELSEFCESDSLSEEGLREIIGRHGLTPMPNKNNLTHDFFHDACNNKRVTEGIIQCLLEYFSATSLRSRDALV